MITGDNLSDLLSPQILQSAFPGMREKEAKDLISAGKVRTFPPETVICNEGANETTFYVLIDGEVSVTKKINDNEARFLKYLKPGDFFGEMAIIHEAPRAATITATSQTTVLEIGKETFVKMLERSSGMSLAMVREVSRRLRENDEMAIDDFRQKARELSNAYQQLERLENARSEFLSTIAHELRTPLQAAAGFMKMIQSGSLNGEALNAALEIIGRNLQDIVDLVNNILFLQEMDLILPELQPIDIGAVVAASVEKQRANAERNHIGLRLDISSDLPLCLGDSKSLERAFTAILDNAIKFSPDGGDTKIEVNHRENQITVKFIDQGIGISPEIMPHIFDRFYHLDTSNDHLFRGAGLGLSIARQVIAQHNGTIYIESKPDYGSTFIVNLRAQ